MTEELAVYKPQMDVMTLGTVLAKSGFFQDSQDQAKAVVKVLAGQELGFGPIASMTGIHVISGKPTLSANLIAASIRRKGSRYDYRIVTLTDERCEIAFYLDGKELQPHSLFTVQDAQKAELTNGKNAHSWKHYSRNMLFARAISNGARWHCPEIFSGVSVYTPEEMGAMVDGETGEIINGTATVVPPTPPPTPAPTNGGNGHSREKLVTRLHELAQESAALGQPVELDLTWLTEAADSELIAYGKTLAAQVAALRTAPQQKLM